MFEQRMSRVRQAMVRSGVDVMGLSVGSDLPWLIGYDAHGSERLTMLLIDRDGGAQLIIPGFEVPKVVERSGLFELRPWKETEDPIGIAAELIGAAKVVAIGDHTWSRFTIELQNRMSGVNWLPASALTSDLRAVKDAAEIERLQRAASGVDRVAAALQQGEIPLVGRTEAEVSADLARRVLAEGHARVNFAIVASGPNAASPHHQASNKIIEPGEVVLCDFGGKTAEADGEPGYCSDITRCVYTGEPPEEYATAYARLLEAQQMAVEAAQVGTPASDIDRVARDHLATVGLDRWFLHRLGHGIGLEEHEDPYLVEGNDRPLEAGNAFSVEPGFYVEHRWGARIEDIVVATEDGPRSLNQADHELAVVEA